MKVNAAAFVFPQNKLNHSKPVFRGVFGERKLFNSFENDDYTAKEYYMDYYPFADESKEDIRKIVDEQKQSLDKAVERNYRSVSIIDIETTHITVQEPLLLSKHDLYQIQEGKMPKMLERIEHFIRAHANDFKKW